MVINKTTEHSLYFNFSVQYLSAAADLNVFNFILIVSEAYIVVVVAFTLKLSLFKSIYLAQTHEITNISSTCYLKMNASYVYFGRTSLTTFQFSDKLYLPKGCFSVGLFLHLRVKRSWLNIAWFVIIPGNRISLFYILGYNVLKYEMVKR